MYEIGIVGLGAAGLLCLGLLPDDMMRKTIAFESGMVGGDLTTKYGCVLANIPARQIRQAFLSVPRWKDAVLYNLEKYKDDECPLLSDSLLDLRMLTTPLLKQITFCPKKVVEFAYNKSWILTASDGASYDVRKLVLSTGAVPKTLDLPIPSIPLEIALCPNALARVVPAPCKIGVFGTSHSGTLVLKNLKNIGHICYGFHKGQMPFLYAREGFSEGIKQESAQIADEISEKLWGANTPSLISLDDFAAAYRTLSELDYVVYAIGFERCNLFYTCGGEKKPFIYDSKSHFVGAPSTAYGFGIGFPTFYTSSNGKSYPDVGFGPFVDAIKAALPSILEPVSEDL